MSIYLSSLRSTDGTMATPASSNTTSPYQSPSPSPEVRYLLHYKWQQVCFSTYERMLEASGTHSMRLLFSAPDSVGCLTSNIICLRTRRA